MVDAPLLSVVVPRFDEDRYLDLILTQAVDYIQMDVCCQGGYALGRRLFAEIARQGLRFAFHSWGTALEVAAAAQERDDLPEELRGALAAVSDETVKDASFPYGCHVCEVEIDPDTGTVEIVGYSSVDDGGQAINPLILHGQVHGGVAQGVGQAMLEAAVYEDASGELLSASFLDYAMPRADHLPSFAVELTEDPTRGNALRVKGGGEAGITPSPAALINAVIDAIGERGIEHLDMPATAPRVWAAMRGPGGR